MSQWTNPEYSRSKIRLAGEILRKSDDPFNQIEAIEKLNNWKAAHELPLSVIKRTISKYAQEVSKTNVIVQRRKRTDSILLKLRNESKLSLARMQDLVGIRVVYRHDDYQKNLDCIDKLIRKIQSSSMSSRPKITNYIENPRDTGYRSVHLIFKYKSKKFHSHNNMLVELQIRTKMQHIWSTAVESVGMFNQSHLKQGLGDEKWLEFFRITSQILAIEEGTMQNGDDSKLELCNKLKVLSQEINALEAFNQIQLQHPVIHTIYQKEYRKLKRKQLEDGYILFKLDFYNRSPLCCNKY